MERRNTPEKARRGRGSGVPSPMHQSPTKRPFAQRGVQKKAFPAPPPTRYALPLLDARSRLRRRAALSLLVYPPRIKDSWLYM